VFEKTGSITYHYQKDYPMKSLTGETVKVTVTWQADVGRVFTDDGKPIAAMKATSDITMVVKDANGNVLDSPQKGDVGIYTDSQGNVVHSVTLESTDAKGNQQVDSKGGIDKEEHTAPGPGKGTAWFDPNAKMTWYHKTDSKKDTPDAGAATTSNP
jgi:hypothetical protein